MIVFLCFVAYNVEVKNKLSHVEQYTWPKILNRMTTDGEQLPMMPFIFKVPEYTEKLENNETWTSPQFTAVFKHDYTTWLSIASAKGKTVSFFFKRTYLTPWQWPQNAMFSLELLNQQYDNDHYHIPFLIDIRNCLYVNEATVRYTTGFISADFLEKMSNQYLKNGNAYFRVSHDKSIYNYVDWFMRRYLNLTLSNYYSSGLLWIIGILMLIECQLVFEAQLKEFVNLNETFLKILEFFVSFVVLYILYNIGAFQMWLN